MAKRPTTLFLGRDHEILPILIGIHSPHGAPILDATFSKGVMWKKSGITPDFTMDIRSADNGVFPTVQADFRNLPFSNQTMGTIVFDPPHLSGTYSVNQDKGVFLDRYGLGGDWRDIMGDDVGISSIFIPFLLEAKRILIEHGVVLCKIADQVNAHEQQFQHVDLIIAARQVGLKPCDLAVKSEANAGSLMGNWSNIYHLRKAHSFWIVLRNSNVCERPLRLAPPDVPDNKGEQLALWGSNQ